MITTKQLTAFNRSQGGGIDNAPSFNEAVNQRRGLPNAETRRKLRLLYVEKFGLMTDSRGLTMGDVLHAQNTNQP